MLAWFRVLGHARAHQPDVILLGDLRFAIEGRFVDLLRRVPGRPVVVDLAHTPRPHSRRRSEASLVRHDRRTLAGLGRAYRSLDAVVVLGSNSRRELLETWPAVRRVEVVPHGADGIFADRAVPPADTAGPEILFFGNLDRYKGLDLLLEAFRLVRERHPAARLVIAGSPSAELDVTRLATRTEAIGGVDLRLGYVPIDGVAALFATARVVVLPYLIANQSGVAHVAYRFGRPVVATMVGDLGDVVRDHETGLLVPPGDPSALADALTELLGDPELAARLGAAGRCLVSAEGSWDEIAQRLEHLFLELLTDRPIAGPSVSHR